MDNVRLEGTEDQSVTSPSGYALGSNVHVTLSKHIRKSPQRHDAGIGDAREWNNDSVASILYMIQDGYLNRNVHRDDIL